MPKMPDNPFDKLAVFVAGGPAAGINGVIKGIDQEAARKLTSIKLDAEASGLWFVVEIMGRYTGHLALEAGLAAGCTRVLIPEEGTIALEGLVSLIRTRAHCGHHWGVVLVAESAH